MKTVKEYLDELPEPFRSQVFANNPLDLNAIASNAARALDKAMAWARPKEGPGYWSGVYSCLDGAIKGLGSPEASRFQEAVDLFREATESPLPVTKDSELVLIKYLEHLPDGYRELALRNHEKWPNVEKMPLNLAEAISYAQVYSRTPEGSAFWYAVESAIDFGTPFPPIPLSAEPAITDKAPPQQHAHNMHPKYSDQPVAQITAVFGTDVSAMSASDCLNAIKSINSKAKALTDTGIVGPYIDEQVNNLKAANEVLITQLNSFVKAPIA